MPIATQTGDAGTTALLFGKRVSKTHPRVLTYGQIDEFSSALGLCRAHTQNDAVKANLCEIQNELVYIMSEIATDDTDQQRFHKKYAKQAIGTAAVKRLTAQIEVKEAASGRFAAWIHAGETIPQAFFNHSRTSCRRSERALVALQESGATVRPELLQYFNRLADLLWLLSREH